MDLKQQIDTHLEDNDFQAALDKLKEEELSENQKKDWTYLQQRFNKTKQESYVGLDSQENIRVRNTQLTKAILEFTEGVINGETEQKAEFSVEPPSEKSFTEKIKETPPKYILLAILILEILIGILGKLMPDEIKPILEEFVGKENYWIAWTIVLVVTIAAFLYLAFRKETPKTKTERFSIARKTEITDKLRLRYDNRLKQKTDNRLPVDLKLTYTKEGTSDDYGHWDKGIRVSQKLKGDWVTTLKKHQQILIIGNPGAGKTTQLLELAVAWLDNKTCTQIPVVFNLAPWKITDEHFHEWLASILVSGYGFSKELAKEAIDNNRILPLLDGLDEVGTNEADAAAMNKLRSHCLAAIDDYIKQNRFKENYLIICSRINEYAAASDAPIKAEVLVNSLTPKDIHKALKTKSDLSNADENAANNILTLFKQYPHLETVLCTPFYYNIALEVFASRTESYNLPNNTNDLEQFLVKAYLAKTLKTTANKRNYESNKTTHSLSFIANMLNTENIKNFEIVSFQYWHLTNKWRMNLVCGLVVGLVYGLVYGLVVGLVVGLVHELFDTHTFINIEKPYHRLRSEVFFTILQSMFVVPLAIISAKYFQGELQAIADLYYWLGLGLLVGFGGGLLNTAFFNHIILCLCLKWEKKLPLDWVSFFEYVTNARILEQDGGQWRFRHQILEDYFLEEWKREN
jgi:hypothetical protein